MNANLATILYLVAGVLFILALRGLSSPASSRQGNRLGMIGMGLAVLTTLALKPPASVVSWLLVILGFAIGGSIGAWRARTIRMTAMPQLVAMFHSLVGLAAVDSGSTIARVVGFIALTLASVNIFGGFLVTERMLAMYKKKG